MMRLPENLTRPITTLDEGKRWICDLVMAGLLFHFEDDPADILGGPDWGPLFTPEEAAIVRERVAELYALPGWADSCPIGFALDHLKERNKP